MRLLYLINGLGPGGAERSLAGLVPYFLEQGIEPQVMCLRRWDYGVESEIRDVGCDVLYMGASSTVGRVRELRSYLTTQKPDLLHTTLFDADLIGRLAAAGTGVPSLTSLVNTSYDPIRLGDPNVNRVGLAAVRTLDAWTARHLTAWFHALTEAVKVAAVRDLGIAGSKVTVIPRGRSRHQLGMPGPDRRRESRERLGLAENARVVVNVARQEYQKGQGHLLEAAARLAMTHPDMTTLLCGREGHATPELRRAHERLNLGERVRFLGNRNDVPDVLAASDLFVFPSLYEGQGGAVIEAMAMGLPIVCSDIPALREVVSGGINGLLVPSGSPEALASAIGRVLDDEEEASRLGRNSQRLFSEKYTLERSAKAMVALYDHVVGLSRGQAPSERPRSTQGESALP